MEGGRGRNMRVEKEVSEHSGGKRHRQRDVTGRWQGGPLVSAQTFRETFFQLLAVTGRSSHVELSLFQAWLPLSEFTD